MGTFGLNPRPRYSIKGLLLFILAIACAVVVVNEYQKLYWAREQYRLASAAWMARRTGISDVSAASLELLQAELRTPLVSRTTAFQHHIARLRYLVERTEGLSWQEEDGQQREQRKYDCDVIRAMIENAKAQL